MWNSVGECLYQRRQKSSAGGIVLNIVLVIFALFLMAEIIFNATYTGIYVINRSMLPTFTGADAQDVPGGDYVYLRTGAVPEYGDVVVVYRERENDNIIKRAIAFEGQTVELERGKLYIDGVEKEQPYVATEKNHPDEPCNTFGPITVGAGEVFLLGDNRDESSDSRQNGCYLMENVLGVVPEWSIKLKSITTAWHTFFRFTLRGQSSAEIFCQNALCI